MVDKTLKFFGLFTFAMFFLAPVVHSNAQPPESAGCRTVCMITLVARRLCARHRPTQFPSIIGTATMVPAIMAIRVARAAVIMERTH